MPQPEFCQVMTTVDSRDVAAALAGSVVRARLAACAQVIGPVASTYRWAGQVEQAQEWLLLLKTTMERYPALRDRVRAEHPYEVPEIICVPVVAGDPAYLHWVATETMPGKG